MPTELSRQELKWINLELGRAASQLKAADHPLSLHFAECYESITDKLQKVIDGDAKIIRITGK